MPGKIAPPGTFSHPPPPPGAMVFPPTLQTSKSMHPIPHPNKPGVSPSPIVGVDASDWKSYAENSPGQGGGCRAQGASALARHRFSVGHILAYYSAHGMPADLCPNCFRYHPGHGCPDPQRDLRPYLRDTHPRCTDCHTQHPPARCPLWPPPPL